jgi:hypothetical protein
MPSLRVFQVLKLVSGLVMKHVGSQNMYHRVDKRGRATNEDHNYSSELDNLYCEAKEMLHMTICKICGNEFTLLGSWHILLGAATFTYLSLRTRGSEFCTQRHGWKLGAKLMCFQKIINL